MTRGSSIHIVCHHVAVAPLTLRLELHGHCIGIVFVLRHIAPPVCWDRSHQLATVVSVLGRLTSRPKLGVHDSHRRVRTYTTLHNITWDGSHMQGCTLRVHRILASSQGQVTIQGGLRVVATLLRVCVCAVPRVHVHLGRSTWIPNAGKSIPHCSR